MKSNKVIGIIGIDYVNEYNRSLDDLILTEWFEDASKEISELL